MRVDGDGQHATLLRRLHQAGRVVAAADDEATVGQVLIDFVASTDVHVARLLIFSGTMDSASTPDQGADHRKRQLRGAEGQPTTIEMRAGWTVDDRPAQPNGTQLPLADYPFLELMDANSVTICENAETDERLNETSRQMLALSGLSSFVTVPMSVGQHWLGVLFVGRDTPSIYEEELVYAWWTLAGQAAAALDNLRLLTQESRYRIILEDIQDGYYEVDLAGTHTFANDSLAKILGYSPDEMTGMSYKQYMDQENARQVFKTFNQVYRTNEPIRGVDYEVTRKDGTKRTIQASVNLTRDSENQVTGFRGVVRDITERKQAEDALREAQQQTQAALAETESLARELSALHKVSLELAQEQQDLNAVLETITRRTMDLLDTDGGGVWLWREEDQELELTITFQVGDTDFAGRRLKPGEGLTGRAFAEKKLQVVNDYQTWAGQSSTFEDASFFAALAAPMMWQNQPVGALVASRSQRGRPFSANEQNLVELLAGQAAAIIQNARLFEQRQQQLANLATIQETTSALTATRSFDEAVAVLLPQVTNAVRADRVSMFLIQEEQMIRIGTYPVADQDTQAGQVSPLADYPLTQKVVETRQPLALAADDPRLQEHARQAFKAAGVTANATIPLVGREGVLGTLAVSLHQPGRAFTEQEISLLQTLADQATIAFENVRLFEQSQARARREQILREITNRLRTPPDVDGVMRVLTQELGQALGRRTFVHLGQRIGERQGDE